MLKNLKNNDGVVFVTVLAIIITMMILTVSILSLNTTQTIVSENEVKRLKAEILSTGALAFTFANQLSDTPSDRITLNESLDGITYDVSIYVDPSGSDPDSKPLTIDISY